EMDPWIETLKKLKAKYGKYATTGNHDYGTYVKWSSKADQENNLKQFFKNMERADFTMLNNTNVPLVIANDTLYLAGVENWGLPPFPCFGKLTQALEGTDGYPVILLSHDPSHWRQEVLNYPVDLMLAGHTHAMQLGINIGSFGGARQYTSTRSITDYIQQTDNNCTSPEELVIWDSPDVSAKDRKSP
ncbi:MAG: metallophosphoesterase, partial [Butyricimonas faecalis]